jgi:hypothetical protein
VVSKGKSGTGVPARLVIIPPEPEAAPRAPERARRDARPWGWQAAAAAIGMAGQRLLLTSLPVVTWPALCVLSSYRWRWQVGLACKRMTSPVGLEELRARDPDRARAWISTALRTAADADLTPATAEPGEADDDDPAAGAKAGLFPPSPRPGAPSRSGA